MKKIQSCYFSSRGLLSTRRRLLCWASLGQEMWQVWELRFPAGLGIVASEGCDQIASLLNLFWLWGARFQRAGITQSGSATSRSTASLQSPKSARDLRSVWEETTPLLYSPENAETSVQEKGSPGQAQQRHWLPISFDQSSHLEKKPPDFIFKYYKVLLPIAGRHSFEKCVTWTFPTKSYFPND